MVLKEPKVHLEHLDNLDNKEHKGRQVNKVSRVVLDSRVPWELLEPQDPLDLTGLQDL